LPVEIVSIVRLRADNVGLQRFVLRENLPPEQIRTNGKDLHSPACDVHHNVRKQRT